VQLLDKKAKKEHYKKKDALKRITAVSISIQTKCWAYRGVVLRAGTMSTTTFGEVTDSDTHCSARATFCGTLYCGTALALPSCSPQHDRHHSQQILIKPSSQSYKGKQ